ncbi:N-acetylmuramidase family protein [Saprospira sp. CCB-QB6]|uniref:N-acetylmuramidase family protein n=1 Tax=Saprospira sp. CCB-QB6 TaxID=3023936 RepID=UPI002349CCC6|nr:N-acetylmuramidase family protein [Saprospira sp. CCB-QB6]WCL81809.1 N-acetylmuramidase family protein [Saprospira sp. CCB-QB6]
MANVEKLQQLLGKYQEQLKTLKDLFMADGKIDANEQATLNQIEELISSIGASIGSAVDGATAAAASSRSISASVGKGGTNKLEDVKVVQELLNQKGQNLTVDGLCGKGTIGAIEAFQQAEFGWKDGRIDPGGKSWSALSGGGSAASSEDAAAADETSSEEGSSESNSGTTDAAAASGEVEEALSASSKISASVGAGGKNQSADVLRVKQLLNKFGHKLTEDGNADAALTAAIKDFQTKYRGSSNPDGRVDAGGRTWNSLLGMGRIQGQLEAMAKQYSVEPAVIMAIQTVESGGNGFFSDGRPKILFEGHIFWNELKKVGKDPNALRSGNENIIYPKWDSSQYAGGTKEYDRLAKAEKIHKEAAYKATSWGEFQIMGFNHSTVGYSDVFSFVEAMKVPNGASLKAVMEFVKNNNLLRHVQGSSKDWASFAKGYNGPGYAKNQYDKKLAAAFARFQKV